MKRTLRFGLPGFVLSFVNLLGAFLTIAALGGLGAWTEWQFIGLFGAVEVATGIAFIIGPNIWHLPVAQGNTTCRTDVQLAASTILLPHWAASAKAAAGFALAVAAAWHEGAGVATLGLPVFIVAICSAVIGLSLVVARAGVARPDLDVLNIVVKRPGRKDHELPGISLGASVVQLLANVGSFPAVKLFAPSMFYQPEIGPSPRVLALSAAIGALLTLAGYAAWRGRMSWRAPREQQREAERVA
ncbi:MAG: hypothetical protein HYX51_05060 [Chloroflexi bacterium]|nr:hypothetical protein [Chloroflexota bacterium]